jgi:hypothetical protein
MRMGCLPSFPCKSRNYDIFAYSCHPIRSLGLAMPVLLLVQPLLYGIFSLPFFLSFRFLGKERKI